MKDRSRRQVQQVSEKREGNQKRKQNRRWYCGIAVLLLSLCLFGGRTMAAAAEQVSPNENLQTTDASVTQKKKLQRSSSNKKSLALAKQMLSAKEKALEKRRAALEPVLTYVGEIIQYYYLEEVNINALVQKTLLGVTLSTTAEDAIKRLVAGLGDPYSAYFTAAEFQNVMDSSKGNYYGIGASIQKEETTGGIQIVEPFSGGPAQKAGLKAGDIILKVDGLDVTKMDLDQAISYVKGEQGTPVVLEYLRNGSRNKVTVYRDLVKTETVSYQMKENRIGYIQISQFEEVTVEQFNEAVAELERQHMKGLIIDLRDNPGGLLTSVSEILDRILPEGKLITYTEDKYGNRENLYTTKESELNLPMVVLVNGNSASASELFTGAMKDYGMAKIVGENTFGKGIVQGFLQFTDGSSLKLTMSKYYTPNGICIHKTGIRPDYVIEKGKDGEDKQLEQALKLLK